jgi:hypothetical protein
MSLQISLQKALVRKDKWLSSSSLIKKEITSANSAAIELTITDGSSLSFEVSLYNKNGTLVGETILGNSSAGSAIIMLDMVAAAELEGIGATEFAPLQAGLHRKISPANFSEGSYIRIVARGKFNGNSLICGTMNNTSLSLILNGGSEMVYTQYLKVENI